MEAPTLLISFRLLNHTLDKSPTRYLHAFGRLFTPIATFVIDHTATGSGAIALDVTAQAFLVLMEKILGFQNLIPIRETLDLRDKSHVDCNFNPPDSQPI